MDEDVYQYDCPRAAAPPPPTRRTLSDIGGPSAAFGTLSIESLETSKPAPSHRNPDGITTVYNVCVSVQVCLLPSVILNAPPNLCPDGLTLTEGRDLLTVNFSLRCQTSLVPPPPPRPRLSLQQELQQMWP